MEIFEAPVITEDRKLKEEEKIKLPLKYTRQPSTETETESDEQIDQENLYNDFMQWRLNPTPGKIKVKPNATVKLWTTLKKEDLPAFNEEQWLRKIGQIIEDILNKKLAVIRISICEGCSTEQVK